MGDRDNRDNEADISVPQTWPWVIGSAVGTVLSIDLLGYKTKLGPHPCDGTRINALSPNDCRMTITHSIG